MSRSRKLVCQHDGCNRIGLFETLLRAYESDWTGINDYGVRVDAETVEHRGNCPQHSQGQTDGGDDDDDEKETSARARRLRDLSQHRTGQQGPEYSIEDTEYTVSFTTEQTTETTATTDQ